MSTLTGASRQSQRARTIADILRAAHLNAAHAHNLALGHHVFVSGGGRGGTYYVIPASDGSMRVRWQQIYAGTHVGLDTVDTAARAAGLILDHQSGLLP